MAGVRYTAKAHGTTWRCPAYTGTASVKQRGLLSAGDERDYQHEELDWEKTYDTRELKRPYAQDPSTWRQKLSPASTPLGPNKALQDEALVDYVSLCADIIQLNYSCFSNTKKDAGSEPTGRPAYCPCQLTSASPKDLNVEADSPARQYVPGIAGPDGKLTIDDNTFYLYGTAGVFKGEFQGVGVSIEHSYWMGYVSIGPLPDGSKNIMIVFRGTQKKLEWVSDAVSGMVPWVGEELETPGAKGFLNKAKALLLKFGASLFGQYDVKDEFVPVDADSLPEFHPLLQKCYISRGFEQMYRRFVYSPGNTLSMQGQVHVAVRKLLAKYGTSVSSITVTGHSLGGALATLCAFDLSASGINRQSDSKTEPLVPVTCVTFNAPRVGNWAFSDFFEVEKGPRHLRIYNTGDTVPRVPYISWGDGWRVFRFLWWMFITPQYITEVFGKHAGEESVREPKGEKQWRYGYHHSGHHLGVDTDWKEEEESLWKEDAWWVKRMRAITQLPFMYYPFLTHHHQKHDAAAANKSIWRTWALLHDFSIRHSFQKLMAVISPSTRGPEGPKSLSVDASNGVTPNGVTLNAAPPNGAPLNGVRSHNA